MTEEMLILVDFEDNVTGSATKSEIRRGNLLHRGSSVLLFNSKGEILIHRRSFEKDIYPGEYAALIGGGSSEGESYEETARRELEEELGIVGVTLHFITKVRFTDETNNFFGKVFKCIYDGPIKIQKEEIISGMFVSLENLKKLMKEKKFATDDLYIFNKYLNHYHEH